jgi:hypothetical protein
MVSVSIGGLICVLFGGAIGILGWFQERAWRKQVQRERDWWREHAFEGQRFFDDAQQMNWTLLDRLKRATGVRKDVN